MISIMLNKVLVNYLSGDKMPEVGVFRERFGNLNNMV